VLVRAKEEVEDVVDDVLLEVLPSKEEVVVVDVSEVELVSTKD